MKITGEVTSIRKRWDGRPGSKVTIHADAVANLPYGLKAPLSFEIELDVRPEHAPQLGDRVIFEVAEK